MHTAYVNKGLEIGHLVEELGEALQAAGKFIRFGGASTNPDIDPGEPFYGETNAEWVLRELQDVERAIARFRLLCKTS